MPLALQQKTSVQNTTERKAKTEPEDIMSKEKEEEFTKEDKVPDIPLRSSWILQRDDHKKKSKSNWGSNIEKILQFGTVQEFWRLFNNIAAPCALANRSNYHLFKAGIEPTWEDPANVRGGHWVIGWITPSPEIINRSWLHLCLGLIGEQFQDSDLICGLVMKVMLKNNRMQLWTRTAAAKDKKAIMRIAHKIIELLHPVKVNLGFKHHHNDDKKSNWKILTR